MVKPGSAAHPFVRIAGKTFSLFIMLTLLIIPIMLMPQSSETLRKDSTSLKGALVRFLDPILTHSATLNPALHSKELASRILFSIAAILLAVLWTNCRGPNLGIPQAALAAYAGANLLSCLFSGKAAYSFFDTWHLWALPLIAIGIYQYCSSSRILNKIYGIIIGTAGIVAGYGLLIYFKFNPLQIFFPFVFKADSRDYIASFTGNAEYFGGYMAPNAVLALCGVFSPRASKSVRLGWLAATLFFLLCIFLSGTRSALLGFLFGATILVGSQLWFLPAKIRRLNVFALAGAALASALIVLIFSTPNPLNRREMRLAQRFAKVVDLTSDSVRERILFYSMSGRMIAAHPLFGSGPGTFRLEFYPAYEKLELDDPHASVQVMGEALRNRISEHAHNDYLEIWAETGTLGLAAFLFMISAAIMSFVKRRSQLKPLYSQSAQIPDAALLRTKFFASAACLYFNALFSFPFHLPIRASLAWILTGCFFAADGLLRDLMAKTPRKAEFSSCAIAPNVQTA